MSEKYEISDQELLELAEKIDRKETTFKIEATKRGMDRTTLSKKINTLKDKMKGTNNLENKEEYYDNLTHNIPGDQDENKEQQQNEKQETDLPSAESKDETEKVTFTLSKALIRAMRFKAVNEDKKTIDIVREALNTYIEKKYFDTVI